MKAIRTHGRGGPERLFFEDAPLPGVRRGDVLLQVRATGITPTELTWDETYQNAHGAPRIPLPLARAREALEHGTANHAPGKIVLQVAA